MTDPTLTDRIDLPRNERAPGLARRFVGERLARWGLDGISDTAQLLVSELVTNAVLHAQSGASLRIQHGAGTLRVTVVDQGPGTDGRRHHAPSPEDLGGRGLFIVDQLASRWGSGKKQDGNHVWFELTTT